MSQVRRVEGRPNMLGLEKLSTTYVCCRCERAHGGVVVVKKHGRFYSVCSDYDDCRAHLCESALVNSTPLRARVL